MQEGRKVSVENNQDGCRIANNALVQLVLTADLMTSVPAPLHAALMSFIDASPLVPLPALLHFSDWLHAYPMAVSPASIWYRSLEIKVQSWGASGCTESCGKVGNSG